MKPLQSEDKNVAQAQADLVDFIVQMRLAFEENEGDLNDIDVGEVTSYSSLVLRASRNVTASDWQRQKLLEDLRIFVLEVEKSFLKNQEDLNDMPYSLLVDDSTALLARVKDADPDVSKKQNNQPF